MSDKIEARGITAIELRPVDKDTVGLIFTDTAEKQTGFLLNPSSLRRLLELGLELAARWAEEPDLQLESWTGSGHALLAQRISLEPGRDEKECAVRLYLGKLELTFLTPLNEIVPEMEKILNIVSTEPQSVH